MNEKYSDVLKRAILLARARNLHPDDDVALDDETMLAALQGRKRLTASARARLLGSPLTLRRMAALATPRRAPLQDAAPPQWSCSKGVLRAADSGCEAAPLRTEDGWWRLDFPGAATGWMMVLKLEAQAPFGANWRAAESPPEVAVLDMQGRTLLLGPLDDEGELWGDWPLSQAPLAVLRDGFRVEAV